LYLFSHYHFLYYVCSDWHVADHPDDPTRSRIYFSMAMSLFDSVPSFVAKIINQKALNGSVSTSALSYTCGYPTIRLYTMLVEYISLTHDNYCTDRMG
jgi:hypothetical protein